MCCRVTLDARFRCFHLIAPFPRNTVAASSLHSEQLRLRPFPICINNTNHHRIRCRAALSVLRLLCIYQRACSLLVCLSACLLAVLLAASAPIDTALHLCPVCSALYPTSTNIPFKVSSIHAQLSTVSINTSNLHCCHSVLFPFAILLLETFGARSIFISAVRSSLQVKSTTGIHTRDCSLFIRHHFPSCSPSQPLFFFSLSTPCSGEWLLATNTRTSYPHRRQLTNTYAQTFHQTFQIPSTISLPWHPHSLLPSLRSPISPSLPNIRLKSLPWNFTTPQVPFSASFQSVLKPTLPRIKLIPLFSRPCPCRTRRHNNTIHSTQLERSRNQSLFNTISKVLLPSTIRSTLIRNTLIRSTLIRKLRRQTPISLLPHNL